jgi:hypothetical protein
MSDINSCPSDLESPEGHGAAYCEICNKELDHLTSLVSSDPRDSIYICFESIKQKIFVYGKYLGGKYGAIGFSKYYTKEECGNKVCEEDIKNLLSSLKKDEYSRLITCNKGNMESIILTKDLIGIRKNDLLGGGLNEFFSNPNSGKKYYCQEHALDNNYRCQCGADLIQLGSEKHRDLTGMEDQKFIGAYLNKILSL